MTDVNLSGVIPYILKDKLNDTQLSILRYFLTTLPKDRREFEIEEDCSGMSSIEFRITSSGIGDNITAHYLNKSIWLSDGEYTEEGFIPEIKVS